MAKAFDKSLSDPCWKDFPPTIIVHGADDNLVLLQGSKDAVAIIGRS
jgi:hypothetical protein